MCKGLIRKGMKTGKYILAVSVAAAAVMAGCQRMENVSPVEENQIELSTSLGGYTKVSGLDFNEGDVFGLYMLEWNGEEAPVFGYEYFAQNLMCTKTADGINFSRTYWPENKLDMYAYYPYDPDGTLYNDPESISHSLNADQSDRLYFDECDFLVASVKEAVSSDKPVQLVFSHVMSYADVQLIPGEGMTAADLKNATMTVKKAPLSCTVNIVTGAVKRGMWTGNITPFGNRVSIDGENISLMSFITVPFSVKAGTELFEITIGDRKFHYAPESDFEFRSGYKYRFEITLNEAQMPAAVRMTESVR